MIAFIEKLNSEVLRSIERIESRDTDVLKKSLEASRVLGEAFDRLKQYIIGYRFQNDDEEIKFFKEIKPRLFCRLIYYRKLYNIEMNRPVGSIEAQREYLDAHVRAINAYTQKRLDFIRYFRSGATHLDSLYFLRGQTDTEQYLETFYYELDVTRNFAASLFRNIKYFTLRKLYLCRKWMQKRLQKTTTTGITLPNFDFLA